MTPVFRAVRDARLKRRIAHHALPGRAPHIRHVEVGPAVAVGIEERRAHSRAHIFHARLRRLIAKMSGAVAIKVIPTEIVRDVEIGPAIAVHIAPGGRETEPVVVLAHPRRFRDVFEPATVFRQPIVKEVIRRAIAGVEIRRRILILIFALHIHIRAQVEVDAAIAVVIRRCHAREHALGGLQEMKGIRQFPKSPVTLIQKQRGTIATQHHQVLPAGVPKIDKQRAGGLIQNPHTGALRNILRHAVRPDLIQTIRQAAGLADINLVHTVVIDIADRDALIPVRIDAGSRIEMSPPVWIPAQ